MTLGESLKYYRTKADMTQREVSQQTGINYKTLSNWENDVSKPAPDDLVALANTYHVSTDCLLGRPTQPPAEKAEAPDAAFGVAIQGGQLLIDGVSLSLQQHSANKLKQAIEIALREELAAAKKNSLRTDEAGNIYLTEEQLREYDVKDYNGTMFCAIGSQMYKVIRLENGMYMLSPLLPLDPKPGKKKKEKEYPYAA